MMEKIILESCARYTLIPSGANVTVALSGGADSVALLYALNTLKDTLGITLRAAHLNHLIRGDEALRDEEFAKKLCIDLDIPLICERIDVPDYAKKNSLSLETAARQLRYEFLNRVCDGGLIATAHTASDNLETLLLNLARGTSIDGLCGIPIKRDNIIRPILSCTREMIEAYCDKHSLSFITDSTNLSDAYTRNKIRHQIVPVLKEINPKAELSALNTSRSLGEISQNLKNISLCYLEKNLKNGSLRLDNFSDLPVPVGKRVVSVFLERLGYDIFLDALHIENIYRICLKGGKTGIPKGMYCKSSKGFLTVGREKGANFSDFSVEISQKTENVNNLFLNNALDCDKIIGDLKIRTRRSGDSIRLKNRGCTKALTKLYNEYSVPTELRDALPIISDDKGVVWIYGIGIAQRVAPTDSTKEIYIISASHRGKPSEKEQTLEKEF